MLPEFKNSFNQTWDYHGTSECYGRNYDDEIPFRNFLDEDRTSLDAAKRQYTQRDLVALFDPLNEELPYIFDDFSWSHCK